MVMSYFGNLIDLILENPEIGWVTMKPPLQEIFFKSFIQFSVLRPIGDLVYSPPDHLNPFATCNFSLFMALGTSISLRPRAAGHIGRFSQLPVQNRRN
jgi:hypothetical protein